MTMTGSKRKLSDTIYWQFAVRKGQGPVLLGNDGAAIRAINDTGVAVTISMLNARGMTPSPNGQWTVIYGDNQLDLFGANDQRAISLPIGVDKVLWRPDSAGFFILGGRSLSYYSLDKRLLSQVDSCAQQKCGFSSSWFAWAN